MIRVIGRKSSKKKLGFLVVVLVAALIVGAYLSYQLTRSPGTVVPQVTTVLPQASLLAVTGQIPSSICGSTTLTYTSAGLALNWGNLTDGSEGIQFLCIKNNGTAPATLSVTSSLPISLGSITSPQQGRTLNAGGIVLVELDFWLSPSAPLGRVPSFTITIGGGQ